jgi:hypothetical protein
MAQIHQDFPGSVHIIPHQFGLVEGDHDFSNDALELALSCGALKLLGALESGECKGDGENAQADDDTHFLHVDSLWWEMTRSLTKEIPVPFIEKVVEQKALS